MLVSPPFHSAHFFSVSFAFSFTVDLPAGQQPRESQPPVRLSQLAQTLKRERMAMERTERTSIDSQGNERPTQVDFDVDLGGGGTKSGSDKSTVGSGKKPDSGGSSGPGVAFSPAFTRSRGDSRSSVISSNPVSSPPSCESVTSGSTLPVGSSKDSSGSSRDGTGGFASPAHAQLAQSSSLESLSSATRPPLR